MKRKKKALMEKIKRTVSCFLATVLIGGIIFPYLPPKEAKAGTEKGVVLAWGEEWNHYCIDGSGYVPNCSSTKNDKYMQVNTKEALNSEERAILFWAMLSFTASYCHEESSAGKIAFINQGAEAAGLKKIEKAVSEQDLKAVIHSSAVRAKYDWLDFAVAHQEEYLKLAGLLTDSSETVSGKEIPAVLKGCVSLEEAVQAAGRDGEFVLSFDASGKDEDFLEKVPLTISADGITWLEGTINGWNVEKTSTQLRITNPDVQAQPVYLKFDTSGTDYGLPSGIYLSPDECYSNTLQVWKCVECSGTHATGGKVHALEKHQRTIWMDFGDTPAAYYAVLDKGGTTRKKGEGELEFQVYHHEEDLEADYLVQLYKYDYETGKPLEGASFDLYERFDDKDQVKKEKKGSGEIYEEEIRHIPVLWDGFRLVTSVRTDSEGRAFYKLEKSYHYDKTFCDGHPAPVFASFSQGQDKEQIRAANAELALEWLDCVEQCKEKAKDGTHFHWKMEEIDSDAIQSVAASGEPLEPLQAGPIRSADGQTAYELSGCKADCEETYKAFISMHYSYTFVESIAREGYVLHGQHTEDIPVEIITTDASQNGANGSFGGGYSHEISSPSWILSKLEEEPKEQRTQEIQKYEEPDVANYYTQQIRTQQIGFIEQNLVEYENGNIQKTDLTVDEILEGTLSDASYIQPEKRATISVGERNIVKEQENDGENFGSQIFADAYKEAFIFSGSGDMIEKGPSDLYSHGGGTDGEEAWRIYDHRTEGQIHINKRDMELQEQEKDGYSSYGDTQGDAVLEGAVYGLFAAENLVHPDGITGVVFQANDLVSIASTDQKGNASFLAITEAPGHTYDYKTGSVITTKNGWASKAPKNLYVDTFEIKDYKENEEGQTSVRRYQNYEAENGNCWIGRPLLLGNYYVKELSRSEGYELSVNGRSLQGSNYGADLEVNLGGSQEEETGRKETVSISRAPYVEQQSSGEEEDTMPNVINFTITSQGTGNQGYYLILDQFPKGTRLFRKDTTEIETEVQADSGQKEKKALFDSLGQPIYQRAEAANTYPKRNPDGSFMMIETAVSKVVSSMGKASLQIIDETIVNEILENDSDENGDDRERNEKELDLDGQEGEQFLYIKMKVEMALRANGLETPRRKNNNEDSEDGSETSEYSDRTKGVYNRGVRKGEPDYEGISGVALGNPAADTIYGHSVVSVEIPKTRQDGSPVTAADAILSLIDFYKENPWYSFGGIDGYEETDDGWYFQIYAGVIGSPENFLVLENEEKDKVIYYRIPWIPEDEEQCPRWIYVTYCNNPERNAFGTYENFRSWQTLGIYQCSAVLVSDAVAKGDGSIQSKTVKQNVYYKKGEILKDQEGNPIQAYEWVDIVTTVTQFQEVSCWKEIPLEESDKGLVSHEKGQYQDSYGNEKNDEDSPMETVYKLVLPQVMITLTQEDIKQLPSDSGYAAGDEMGAGDYVLAVLGAKVQLHLNYDSQITAEENLYVKFVSLIYPGQEQLFQDGKGNIIGVQERVIRQPVKVAKSIQQTSASEEGSEVLDNFRFKVYLKTNLEQLYRDEEGTVFWVTKEGEEADPHKIRQNYLALVPKFYTKPRIPVLETTAEGYNYKKFFDAISVANQDKWKAEENRIISDHVQQFAVDWYLEQEVEKLLHDSDKSGKEAATELSYSDQIYEEALKEAVKLAENYLKPFFAYDFDSIYAVEWDCEEEGGKDHDKTTLSADIQEDNWCYGISVPLPYGTYVIVEQQPMYEQLGDLKNRHYQIDVPKEICIPSVYGSYEEARKTPEGMSSYYQYHKEDTSEELQRKYHIWIKGENPVIKAHNYQGDFEIYRYPCVSETEENVVMVGNTTAFDGEYCHSLVPWSMAAPEKEISDIEPAENGESSYHGFAYGKFMDVLYKSWLRIEKLDSQTHENILHDQAIFRLYKAKREESEYGTGEAEFYEKETRITGTKEFLEGMGAFDITRKSEGTKGQETIYSGVVPAGTPICREEDQIILEGQNGRKEGDFKSYTTVWDGLMEHADASGSFYGEQNTGYLEMPQALEAGTYVLVEVKPPAGYTRTKPIALEIYSDKTAYYREGNQKDKVLAVLFRQAKELMKDRQDITEYADLARIRVENTPITIKIEKRKKTYDTVTYKINGRIDGSLAQIGGNPAYEYAYSQGRYLGYAWKKGTLEYLNEQKAAGEQVEIVYHGGIFAGYGYITVASKTADSQNSYVPGATMTLYEGLEVHPSGKKGDYGYEGLMVERDITGTVTRMYVKEGYGGTRIEFKLEESWEQKAEKGQKVISQAQKLLESQKSMSQGQTMVQAGEILKGTWDAVTVDRLDTDILYYDLGNLDIFTKDSITNISYGYDFDHNLIDLEQLNEDRRTIQRTGQEYSIFAFKDNQPYLELTGGDFTKMSYQPSEKYFIIPDGTRIYHIDPNGNRDAQVDPDTGMAFVKEEETGKIYVWPVTVLTDPEGHKIAVDKIATSRIAEIGENPKNESDETGQEKSSYLVGTWKSEQGEESHEMSVPLQNSNKNSIVGEPISYENNGSFDPSVRPILNRYGLPKYYSLSRETYQTQLSLYDKDGNFIRKKSSDLLEDFRKASGISDKQIILENQEPLYHRFGENYLLENTWITGELTPNDPFHTVMTDGQADLLKRIPAGIYIMEETKVPAGYVKGFPVGITIEETEELQTAKIEEDQTKLLIRKLEDAKEYEYQILDMGAGGSLNRPLPIGKLSEGKGSFSHKQMPGVKLALYQANISEDGSEYRKKGKQIAQWETGKEPFYLAGLEKGIYLLEELETPDGFIASEPLTIELDETRQVQVVDMFNDHTKVEFEKYTIDGTEKKLVGGAGFTLYEAVMDDKNQPVYQDGTPQYDEEKVADRWISSDGTVYQGFISAFETMYQQYGTAGRTVTWNVEGRDYEAEYISHQQIDASVSGGEHSSFPTSAELLFGMEQGQQIRIVVYQEQDNRQGRDFTYEYQFDYKKLPQINDYAVSYVTVDGIRRFDYLPAGKSFVLVETRPPEGYGAAPNQIITVEETDQIQRYRIQNQERVLFISKCVKEESGPQEKTIELGGAHLALYRADSRGELIQEPGYLAAEWISGSDGTYTESDQNNGQIPEGYEKGDKKPHELRRLPEGIYYLVELESPDYYSVMEPVKITYSQEDNIRIIRVWNQPAKGELEIFKTDEKEELISGAVFELTAYAISDIRYPVLQMKLSDQGGKIQVLDLPVGKMESDGSIIPYQYCLKELVPPPGYASDLQIHTFQFKPNQKGIISTEGQQIKQTLQVMNQKTRITIRKSDFDSPKQWVSGAELAVYHVIGRDGQGQYLYEESIPEAVWVTEEEQSYVLEGLIAGETYLLIETKAPEGFEKMKPYAFTLSADGRRICSVTGQTGIVNIHSYEGSDIIRSLEIHGRYGVKVEMELCDETEQLIASWTAGGDGHILRAEDGIEEKKVYQLTETTVYSDGSREITGRTTRRVHFTDQGLWKVPDRSIEKVQVSLAHEDGTEMISWIPSEKNPWIEVDNPTAPEPLKITIGNRKQGTIVETAGAVDAADAVWAVVSCINTAHDQGDMILTVSPGDGVAVIDPGDGSVENGQIHYLLEQMKPGECRQISCAFQLEADAEEICISVNSQCMGQEMETRKTVPVLQPDHLTVYYEVTGTGKEQEKERSFQVFLYTAEGEELKGSYRYKGSREGSFKSGDILELAANEYVTIDSGTFYKDIRYQVTDVEGGQSFEGQTSKTGVCAYFSRETTDRSQASNFQKGKKYQLTETTFYSDGSTRDSNKMRLLLDDQVSVEGIDIFNQRQKVSLSKRKITGEEELEGALLQVRKKDGTVLEEWISSNEPHLLNTVLQAGESYILHEEAAPDGYGYEEDILFRVEEGEYVNQVIMEDNNTTVIISKKGLTGEEEVPGAKLQILDEEGNVKEEWISGTTPYEITGKLQAGKNYILHEEEAPDGYGYASDCHFTVAADGSIDVVEMRDAMTHVELSKTDITGEKEIAGAKLKVIDKEGKVICEWTSTEEPYRLVGVLKAGESYILREEAAPDGYAYASDVEFTVSETGSVDHVYMKDEMTRVEVLKVDSETGLGLAGAQLELTTTEGILVEAWTSTEKAHLIEGKLQAGETYILRETAAPSGYINQNQDIPILISKEAQTITVKVENQKRISVTKKTTTTKITEKKEETQEETEETTKVQETERIGKVYTDYGSEFSAHGGISYQAFTNLGLPKLGDSSPDRRILPWLSGILGLSANQDSEETHIAYIIGGILCLLVLAAGLRKKRKYGKFFILLCLCGVFGMFMAISSHAETVEVKPDGQIVVTGDIYQEAEQLPEVLPEIFYYGDMEYERQSYQIVTAMTETGTKEVEEEIIYQEVEQTDTLPETAKIVVTDQRYQTEYEQDFPVIDAEFYNWRWISGFQLPLVVEEADAELYEVNGLQVPAREEKPFEGYEEELLKLADIDPHYYRITEVEWEGEPWIGEDQKIYRNAVAIGEKYVADCQVLYGGTAVLEPVSGVAWQALYQRIQKLEEESFEETEPFQGTGVFQTEEEPKIEEDIPWYQESLGQTIISIGILVICLPFLLVFMKRKQKSLKK